MTFYIDIQRACETTRPITNTMLRQWVELALTPYREEAEVTLRLVTLDEITTLNRVYRQQDKPTNVLSFPATYPKEVELSCPLLGDIILCPAVLKNESRELKTPLTAHWAHIVIHGVLHLLGYDHIKDSDTFIMQAIETALLAQLGISDPYLIAGSTQGTSIE